MRCCTATHLSSPLLLNTLQPHLVLLLLLQQVVLQGLHMLVHLLLQFVKLLAGPVPIVPGLVCFVTSNLEPLLLTRSLSLHEAVQQAAKLAGFQEESSVWPQRTRPYLWN